MVRQRVGERLERLLGVRDGAVDLLQLLLGRVDVRVLGEHVPVIRRLRPSPHWPVAHAHALQNMCVLFQMRSDVRHVIKKLQVIRSRT